VNELQEVFNRGGLGLILSGDFAQLSPVKAEFCFNATCWKEFQITKLTKIFRQSDPEFLEMLNAARRGDGEKTAELAYAIQDIKFLDIIDSHFEGTTIVAVNKQVDRMNEVRLQELIGQGKRLFEFPTFRWGRQYKEWTGIPDIIQVCESAYVMILANDSPNFTYANGSCGHVVDADIDAGRVYVKLQGRGEDENELEVKVRKVTRKYLEKNVPEGYQPVEKWLSRSEWEKDNREKGIESFGNDEVMYKSYLMQLTQASKDRNGNCKPYFDFLEEKWVTGEVTYTPIRLAYATTVYKSQGLSLDKVQIDYSHEFFGSPSMSYVALSRCRTPNGLTIVGNKKLIEQRTNISSEILDWL
jgi:ATP-dependent DNA helicase PIF1